MGAQIWTQVTIPHPCDESVNQMYTACFGGTVERLTATERREKGFLKIMAVGQVLKMDRIYIAVNGDKGAQGIGNHLSKGM